jgi:hypothetical protein
MRRPRVNTTVIACVALAAEIAIAHGVPQPRRRHLRHRFSRPSRTSWASGSNARKDLLMFW